MTSVVSCLAMKLSIRHKPSVFFTLMGVCACGFAAESISPQWADSSKRQRDRDVTLIGGGTPSSAAERKSFLMALREELRTRLTVIDALLRDPSESDSSHKMLRVEREKVLQNEKKVGELIARFESGTQSR
jgi:hypothetical protein